MNVNEYKQSGTLEAYVLGLLNEEESRELVALCKKHPGLKQEIQLLEKSLFQYLSQTAAPVNEGIKTGLLDAIDLIEQDTFSEGSFPLIHKYSDHNAWLSVVKPDMDGFPEVPFVKKVLQQNEKGEISLVRSCIDIMPEVHEDLHESFLVLTGTCTCIVGEKAYHLQPGDFLEIPLYTDHNVMITSEEPVVAILQRLIA